MAVRRSQNFLNQSRVDSPHLRSIESAIRNDFDELLDAFVLGEDESYVLRGFELGMTGAVGSSANGLQLIVAESSIFHGKSSEAGTFFVVPSGTANEILNSTTNTTVEGSFTAATLNYIGLEYVRAVDDSTTSQVYLWNPTNTNEITKTLPLAQTLNYKVVITSTGFASNILPISIVETDASNNVLSVTDSRPMLFRLGTAGTSTPDPFYVYPWTNQPEGRTETFWKSTSSSSPFRGGDKQILTMKEWMDSVMSNLLEIKGTAYWYSTNTGGSLVKARQDLGNTIITGRGTIAHSSATPGLINWSEDVYLTLIGSRLRYKMLANATSAHLTLTDNQVAYINLVRDVDITPNLIFTNGSAVITSVGAVAWTGDVLAGDFVRVAAEDYTKYYEILTVDSLSQVTLTVNFVETSTGAAGIQAKYAWGTYQTNAAPSTNRHIYIADREDVPFDEDTYWLYVRSDHGDSVPTVFIRFLGSELESGESQEINDNTSVAVLKYNGMVNESDGTPDYSAAVGSYEITRIEAPEGQHVTSGQYFTINSANNVTPYYVWLNVDAAGGDPAPGGLTAVVVAINSTDGRNTVSTAIANALNALGDFAASSTLNVTTVTNAAEGNCSDAANVDVGGAIDISTTTQGLEGTLNGQSSYNSNNNENLTVRASKLTSMVADKAQDKTIKFAPDFDSVINTTNAANQDITFTSSGSNSLSIVMNSSANNGTIGLGNTLSLAVNQAAYFIADRNAAFSFANLSNLTVADITAVPLEENIFIFAYRLAGTDIYLWDGLKVSVGSAPSPSFLSTVVKQNKNAKLIEGGTWSWNLGTTTITWSANAFIQIPGLADNVNRILAGNNAAFADGDVLYVSVKRTAGASDLTVNRAAIVSVVLTENTVVIARRVGAIVYFGTGSDRLVDGQFMTLDSSMSDQNQAYVGASNTADGSPAYYSDETYITEGHPLNVSIGRLDVGLTDRTSDINNVQTDIDPPLKLKQNGATGVKEITEIIAVADIGGSLDAQYFTLQDDIGTVGFWIDVDNSGTTTPGTGAAREVEITTITTGMTAAQVGTVVYTAIIADAKFEAGTDSGDGRFRVQSSTTGTKTDGVDGDTGFYIREYVAGVADTLDRVIAVENIRKTLTDNTSIAVQPIDNKIPVFASGTITLPAASGSNITVSVGDPLLLTIANDKFQKLLIALDTDGNIVLISGTDQATKAAAQAEEISTTERLIGEYIISTATAAVNDVTNSDITQYSGGGGAGTGGSGMLNFYTEGEADTSKVSNFTTDSNVIFDGGGGSFSGIFSISTTANDLIGGDSVFKWVGSATAGNNDNDYIASNAIDIPLGYRGRQLGIQLQYKWDGTDDLMKWVVEDNTNTEILTLGTEFIKTHNDANTAATYVISFYCPSDCEQIKIGPQCITGEVSKTFIWDSVIVTPDPHINRDILNITEWEAYTPTITGFGTPTSVDFKWRRVGDTAEIQGTFATGTPTAVEIQVSLPNSEVIASNSISPIGVAGSWFRADTLTVHGGSLLMTAGDAFFNWSPNAVFGSGNVASLTPAFGDVVLGVGEVVALKASIPIEGWTAVTEHIIAYNERSQNGQIRLQESTGFGSSDTKIRRFVNYELDDSGAYAALSGGTFTTGDGSMTITDTAANGTIVTINETAMYHGDYVESFSATSNLGFTRNSSQLTTIVQSTDALKKLSESRTTAGIDPGSTSFTKLLISGDVIRFHTAAAAVGTAAFTQGSIAKIGASQLLGVPLPLTAYVSNVIAANTDAAAFTQAGWRTSVLNTVSGDTAIVVLNTNQFILGPGTYDLSGYGMAHKVSQFHFKIENTTDGVFAVLGAPARAEAGGDENYQSIFNGRIIITSTKVFELQGFCQTTGTFGHDTAASGSEDKVHAMIKITKVN